MASHSSGVVTSREVADGMLIMIYYSPCKFTRTFDYLSEANLVFSADSLMVAWNMSSGRLVLAEDLKEYRITGLLVAPYPGEEDSIGNDVQKLLVACRTQDVVMLWKATSKVDAETGEMSVSAELFNVTRVGSLNRRLCSAPYGDQFHFDGRFLYYLKHEMPSCNGVVCQFEVAIGRMEAEVPFRNPIKKLVGVGKKYMLVIVKTGDGERMDVIDRESRNFLTRVQVCRDYRIPAHSYQVDIFCIGRRSWLDGFDGNNDVGEVFFYVALPNSVNFLAWHDRTYTRYTQHWSSGSITVGRGNNSGRPRVQDQKIRRF